MTDHAYTPNKMLCLGGPLDGHWVDPEVRESFLTEDGREYRPPKGYQHVRCTSDDWRVMFFSHAETHPLNDNARLGDLALRAHRALEEAHAEWEAEHGREEAVGVVSNWEVEE